MNPNQDPHIKGYYLAADVNHDFGKNVPTQYNFGAEQAAVKAPPPPDGRKSLEEDDAVAYIENHDLKDSDGKEFVELGKERRNKRIVFTLPTQTSAFQSSAIPTLYPGGNDKIGIVQDAGKFITPFLGAKNVLTFGSILDPAGKPIDPKDDPIWFKPNSDTGITLSLDKFGFDTNKINKIEISNLRAGLVSSTFVMKDSSRLDAITMKPSGTAPTGSKPINNTEIEKSGFYTSIAKANEIEKNQAAKALGPNRRYLFNVGKTLGDLTLVASCMPKFHDGTSNIYYGVGGAPGQWLDWNSGAVVQAPQVLVLKTGDRLNALRAHMENVPNILEQQASKGRPVKQFMFTPGKLTGKDIYDAVVGGYTSLEENVKKRYDTLIASFRKLLQPDGSVKSEYTIFTETPTIQAKDSAGLKAAGKLILIIIRCLEALRDELVTWLQTRKPSAQPPDADLEALQTQYNVDVEFCTRVAPQTQDILYTKAGVTKVQLKIVVSQVKGAPGNCPINTSLDISLWNAFRKLINGGGSAGIRSIIGTDVYNRFLFPVSELVDTVAELGELKGGKQRGGDIQLEEDALLARFVNSKFVEPTEVGGGQEGGTDITIQIRPAACEIVKDKKDKPRPEKYLECYYPADENVRLFEDEFPLLSLFRTYIKDTFNIQSDQQFLVACYDVYLKRKQKTIVDDVLLNNFLEEFKRLYEKPPEGGLPMFTFEGGDPRWENPETPVTTFGVCAFNAFTYYINSVNARSLGFTNIPEQPNDNIEPSELADITDSSERTFTVLETLFIQRIMKEGPYLRGFRTGNITINQANISKRSGAFADTVRLGFDQEPEEQEECDESSGPGCAIMGGLRRRRPLYTNA
jgi:hypothetical protein